jgi:hypothetical protein
MRPWQIRLSSDDRHPLFPDEHRLRAGVRVLAHTVGRECVLFCIVDDHVHVVLYCEREVVTWRARSLCRVLRARAAVPVSPSWIKPVGSRAHLHTLVGYILDQTGHHGLPVHPALWSGSCFPDLVGARCLPGLELQLQHALPRLQPWEICKPVGLRPSDLEPLKDEDLRSLGAARILAASSAVLGAGPGMDERTRSRFLVHAMTAQAGQAAGLAREELAWALQCSGRHVLRLESAEISETLLRSVRVRLALEEAVAVQRISSAGRRAS